MEWELAACAGLDPEVWFPLADRDADVPKAVCAGCPIRAECLAWALDTGQEFGVWGGVTEDERRALRRPARVRPAA